jgi:5,10-methylenetetrahydrofolate reductase
MTEGNFGLHDAGIQRGATPSRAAAPGARPPKARDADANPLHDLMIAGKMPVVLELHLTEGDRTAYLHLRQRHLARGYELPRLSVLGQALRQTDVSGTDLSNDERHLVHKLQVYADLLSSGAVDLLALDDGSRGRDTLDNAVAAELLIGLGADANRLMANVVARNRFPDQVRRRLSHFADLGVRNALLLTGDLPVPPAPPARFPLDSVGLLELARTMMLKGELPDDFWAAAAGHPNPDADPDGLRTLQKALAGAKVVVTQAIYCLDHFADWMRKLQNLGVLDMVHILAEVIPITSARQLRMIADVPGMRVPEEMVAAMERCRQRVEQAARSNGHGPEWTQTELRREGNRITRELLHQIRKIPGVSGFYLGCVKSFDAHLELLKETPLLPDAGHALQKAAKLAGAERQRTLALGPLVRATVDRIARRIRRQQGRSVSRWLSRRGWAERIFKVLEWPKVPLFGCRKCDQCDLSPDALVCPRGCAKQMSHGPCGAPRWVNGRMLCEDVSRECTWAAIRRRRDLYGVPLSERLEVRPAPSPGFYEGRTYSAVLPVLNGAKNGPSWSLAWRAPWAHLRSWMGKTRPGPTAFTPPDLETLAAGKHRTLRDILADRPQADSEELYLKVLAQIGTPGAWCLFEAALASLGLPAEGALNDLSLGELYELAEAAPIVRAQLAAKAPQERSAGAFAPFEELLGRIPPDRRIRRAIRRELANGLMAHIGLLGVRVTYVETLLDGKFVEDFLTALSILKDELLVCRERAKAAGREMSVDFHRIHNKHHYHAPVAVHGIASAGDAPASETLLRVDMRQFQSASVFRANLREALESWLAGKPESTDAMVLEPYRTQSHSLCWALNAEFWRRLREFEEARGTAYDASIGGSTDRNLAYARSSARAFFDKVQHHGLDGRSLSVLEIGVASTHRAAAFLEEYRRLCGLTGSDSIRRLTYVLADFSAAILQKSAEELSRFHPAFETVQLDAADPSASLSAFKGRVMHAHLCNVYDNLPCGQAVWSANRWHRIEGRLYLPRNRLDWLAARWSLNGNQRNEITARLDRLGTPDGAAGAFLDGLKALMADGGRPPSDYVGLWMDLIAALRFDERYVAVADPDELFDVAIPGIDRPGELVRRHVAGVDEARIHLNEAALGGFARLLPLLHAHGTLEVVDLFVQRLDEYRHSFKGPAKYDGSTVNWLNGPLFRAVAEQLGYTVRFQPFRPFDPKSPSVVLTAYPNG